MTKLTEEMVVARAKQSDLSSIKKLNCWGSELTDVSILKRMANVEVLAFSINNIRSLVEFQHCSRLKELYVRKNKISDLSELRYLRKLPFLKVLWLGENPCAEVDNYRMTVLKALPNLEKLDNFSVSEYEVVEAINKGSLIKDYDPEEDYEPELDDYTQWNRSEESNGDKNAERPEYRNGDNESSNDNHNAPTSYGYYRSSGLRRSPPNTNNPRYQEYERNNDENTPTNTNHAYNRPSALPRSPPMTNGSSNLQGSPVRQKCYTPENYEEPRYEQSQSRSQYFEEYTPVNGDHGGQGRYQHQNNNRHSVDMTQSQNVEGYDRNDRYASQTLSNVDNNQQHYPTNNNSRQEHWERDSIVGSSKERDGHIASAVMGDYKGFTRRPMTRNSNLLSAVLCLVKELDYTSLEVAEMAVRCRMDELANRP